MPDFYSEGSGIVSAFAEGERLEQQNQMLQFERQMRQKEFGLQQQQLGQRQQELDRQQNMDALGVLNQQKTDLQQQIYFMNRDLSNLPAGTALTPEQMQQRQALTQRASQLRDATMEIHRQIMGPRLSQAMGERDALFDDLHQGRRQMGDVEPAELGSAVATATGRPISDFIDTPNSLSPVGSALKAVHDGMIAQQQGKGSAQLLSGFNQLASHELQGLINQHAYDGSTITNAEIASMVPHPGSPQHVTAAIKLTTQGPDGKIGTQYVPLMDDQGHFLAHPDETQNASVKSYSLDGLFNHLGSLQTFYNTINTPDVKSKAVKHFLSGGEAGDQELIDAMHMLGTDPSLMMPKKKVTINGDRALIEDDRGNYQIIALQPTELEKGKLALERSQEAHNFALAEKQAEGGKLAQEEAYIEQYARTHQNPDGSPMDTRQAAAELQGMGLLKTPAAGGAGGGRQNVMNSRVLSAAQEGMRDIRNIMELPISASTGLLGLGGQQEHGLLSAPKNFLTREISTQNQQDYAVMQDGLGRAAAMMESQGLAPSGSLVSAVTNHLAFQPGETYLTRLRKVAQARQTFEAALESTLTNPGMTPDQKQLAQGMLDQIKEAIPFTQHDITALERSKNKSATVSQFASDMGLAPTDGQPAPAAGSGEQTKAEPKPVSAPPAFDAAAQKAAHETGLPPLNADGWHLLSDGKGNYAYVSADGKQHKEVTPKKDTGAQSFFDREGGGTSTTLGIRG